jgi:hypothetical protein
MCVTTASGQSWSKRWQQAAKGSLTLVLLLVVAVVGFSLLGSEVLAAWKAPNDSGKELASGGAFAGLVNFEAPTATVARQEATAEESQKSRAWVQNPLLLKNWKYTQSSTAITEFFISVFQLSWAAFSQGTIILFLDSQSAANQSMFAAQYQLDLFLQSITNSILPPAYRSPPLPPASPTT